jgi:hypothetical protein
VVNRRGTPGHLLGWLQAYSTQALTFLQLDRREHAGHHGGRYGCGLRPLEKPKH